MLYAPEIHEPCPLVVFGNIHADYEGICCNCDYFLFQAVFILYFHCYKISPYDVLSRQTHIHHTGRFYFVKVQISFSIGMLNLARLKKMLRLFFR